MHFNIFMITIAMPVKIKDQCYLQDIVGRNHINCPSSCSSIAECLCATILWQFVLEYKQQTFHACFSVLPPYIHRSRVVSTVFFDSASNMN